MIPTGLATAFNKKRAMILKERGSTGTKGLGQRCGVVDSGFRDEIFVPLTNHNEYREVIISKLSKEDVIKKYGKASEYNNDEITLQDQQPNIFLSSPDKELEAIIYPYEKAICQALMVEVPVMNVQEIPYDDLLKIESERGTGKLGSSGK